MALGFQLGPSLRPQQNCRYCTGSIDNHAGGCPVAALKHAQEAQLFLECPKCQRAAVDANAHDYYECRKCNSQFSRAAHHEGEGERITLISEKGRALPVIVLANKGEGKFPTDDALKSALKLLRQAKPVRRR